MNHRSRIIAAGTAFALTFAAFLALGCNYDENGPTKEAQFQTTNVVTFLASGSTFIAPLITRWAADYEKSNPIHLNYRSIGSGAGIDNLRKGIGAFAASDAPLADDQMQGMPAIVQIPVTAGPVCVVYDLPGVQSLLKLSGPTLAGIFAGDIISWQDPAIGRDNPGVKLPHSAIIVIHRSDGSGTTSIFTSYLSKVSPSFAAKLGNGLSVTWPAGIGADGSSAVIAAVKHNPGTIGYLELSYARQFNVPTASIRNNAGEYVIPSPQSAYLAVDAQTGLLAEDVRSSIVDPPASAKGAYPITGLSFILIPKDNVHHRDEQKALSGFIRYALTKGQDVSEQMSYAKLPDAVQKQGTAALAQLTEDGKPID